MPSRGVAGSGLQSREPTALSFSLLLGSTIHYRPKRSGLECSWPCCPAQSPVPGATFTWRGLRRLTPHVWPPPPRSSRSSGRSRIDLPLGATEDRVCLAPQESRITFEEWRNMRNFRISWCSTSRELNYSSPDDISKHFEVTREMNKHVSPPWRGNRFLPGSQTIYVWNQYLLVLVLRHTPTNTWK